MKMRLKVRLLTFAVLLLLLNTPWGGAGSLFGAFFPEERSAAKIGPALTAARGGSIGTTRAGNNWTDDFTDESLIENRDNVVVEKGRAVLANTRTGPDIYTRGMWRFEEASGDIAYDASDNENQAAIHGAERTEGVVGKGLVFDGGGDYVDFGNDNSLKEFASLTVEGWFKTDKGGPVPKEGWAYRRTVTIDHDKVEGDLRDFPVLVSLTDPDLKDSDRGGAVQPDGGDIAFTTTDGRDLSHEIEEYDGGDGELVAWVKVPRLSSAVDTEFLMYYGNPACPDQQDKEGVWGASHRLVQHLNERDRSYIDSTAYDNDGESHGGVEHGERGKIGRAADFDGRNEYLDFPNDPSLDIGGQNLSLSAWIRPDDVDTHSFIISRWQDHYSMLLSYRRIRYYFMKAGWTWDSAETFYGSVDTEREWYHVAITMAGAAINIYINGVNVKKDNSGGWLQTVDAELYIGAATYQQYYFDGLIDEVRISNASRSKAWIRTSFNNQNEPDSFMAVSRPMGRGLLKMGSYGIHAASGRAYGYINDRTVSAEIPKGWNHIAQTYDGSTQALYVNGELGSIQTFSESIRHNDNPLYLGGVPESKIDEVYIFDRALSRTEINGHLKIYRGSGPFQSVDIELPENAVWNEFSFEGKVPKGTELNISIHDADSGEKLNGIRGSEESTVDLSGIDPTERDEIYIKAHFSSDLVRTPVIRSWTVRRSSPERPEFTREISPIPIKEDTPERDILDLAEHFHDAYSEFRDPEYSIDSVSEPEKIGLALRGSSVDVTGLEENWTGSLTVTASCTNMFGLNTSTGPFKIRVENLNDPPVAKLFLPEDGAVSEDREVTLVWKGFDVDGGGSELVFDLYLGTSETPPLLSSGLSKKSKTVEDLERGLKYYWYVIPNDGNATGRCVNGIWSFSIKGEGEVPGTVLISPANGTSVTSPDIRLKWGPSGTSPGEITYSVHIGRDNNDLVEVGSTRDTEYHAADLADNTTYYWTVTPRVGALRGTCLSGIWHFTVDLSEEPGLVAEADVERLLAYPGEESVFNITLNNSGDTPANVAIAALGSLGEYVTLIDYVIAELGTSRLEGVFAPPPDLDLGQYNLTIQFEYEDGDTQLILPVTVKERENGTGGQDGEDDEEEEKGGRGEVGADEDGGRLWLWLLLMFSLLVTIIAVVLLLFFKKKNGHEQEAFDSPVKGWNVKDPSRPLDSRPAQWQRYSPAPYGSVPKYRTTQGYSLTSPGSSAVVDWGDTNETKRPPRIVQYTGSSGKESTKKRDLLPERIESGSGRVDKGADQGKTIDWDKWEREMRADEEEPGEAEEKSEALVTADEGDTRSVSGDLSDIQHLIDKVTGKEGWGDG